MITLRTHHPDSTATLGAAIGRAAFPGTVIALIGELGTGKTCFTQGLARGLGVTEVVQSPTFIVVATHESGRLPLYHADIYRVHRATDLEQVGLAELIEDVGVTVIEWADKHPHILPADHMVVRMCHSTGGRELSFEATGPKHEDLLGALRG